jgi:hypothetical protein
MERNRINYAKYQITRYVEEFYVGLELLISPDIEEKLNKPSHGLREEELVIVLKELFDDHSLVAVRNERGLFTPTLAEIEQVLSKPEESFEQFGDTHYGITSGGVGLLKELNLAYKKQI